MADTRPNIRIESGEWRDVYALATLAVGTQLFIENVGDSDLFIAVSPTQPDPDHDSYNVLSRKGDGILMNNDDDSGVWVFSNNQNGKVNVSSTKAPSGFNPATQVLLSDGFGNPISSFRGALSSFDSDVNSIMVNEHLRMDEGTTDLLSAVASIRDWEITVVDGAKFAINDRVTLTEGITVESSTIKITNVIGNILTMDKPLENSYTTAAVVTIVIKSLNVDGSTVRQVFSVAPPPGEIWHIYRLTIVMVHSTVASDDLFGNLSKLDNGLVIRQENGIKRNLSIWRDNSDIIEDTGVDLRYSSKSGGGLFGTAARWTFKRAGTVLELSGDSGDVIEAIVQDDLTGLSDLEVKVQGHKEGL